MLRPTRVQSESLGGTQASVFLKNSSGNPNVHPMQRAIDIEFGNCLLGKKVKDGTKYSGWCGHGPSYLEMVWFGCVQKRKGVKQGREMMGPWGLGKTTWLYGVFLV